MKIKRALQLLLKDEQKINDLIEASFGDIDSDGSGAVDQEELFEILRNQSSDADGEQLTLQDVTAAMTELSNLSNDLITIEEYKVLVVSALQFLYQRESNLEYN